MAQCEDCKEIKPVIEQADTDPVTAALTDDFENSALPTTSPPSNTPNTQSPNSTTPETPPEITQIFGINKDFLDEMCIYASPKEKIPPSSLKNSKILGTLQAQSSNFNFTTDPNNSYINKDGVSIGHVFSRGHTVAIFNSSTLVLESVTTYDTWDLGSNILLNALTIIPDGKIVAIASFDATNFNAATRSYVNSNFGTTRTETWEGRSSSNRFAHVIIAQKNGEILAYEAIHSGSSAMPLMDPKTIIVTEGAFESKVVFDLVSEGENRVTLGSPWSSYMNENAVWGSSIRDRNFTREYTFTNEKSGDYVFKYQCDDQITIIVDGREIVKERGNFRPQHQIGVKTIRLLKGSHQIKVIGENFRGPGGMALKIYVIASYDDIQLTIDPTNNSTVPLTKSEKFVVKDGKIYIRKEAQDCGPNDNRTEDVEIGDWENILSPGSDSGDSIARGTYLYYGRPILPGSHCSGSLSPTDLEWWDFDPREESVPTGKVKLSNGTEVSVTEPTIYGYDGDGIDSPPVITDRGCN